MNEFKISFRENAKVHVMDLRGYLDAHTAPNLEEAFQKLLKEGKFNILVNCKDLAYISSAGLRVLLAYSKLLKKSGGRLGIICPKASYAYEVLETAGFSGIIPVFENEADAVLGGLYAPPASSGTMRSTPIGS